MVCISVISERVSDKRGEIAFCNISILYRHLTAYLGIEAIGFIFGPPIAVAIGAKFVPMRKPNKLPGEDISEYSLEYGKDIMEMHVGEWALVIDDLIATGRTLCAVIKLLGTVGQDRLEDKPLFVLVSG
ncbi:hypothetical protein MANES_18G045401v8 [Manihot esculenta]|uniref:Uncharacterized protein n=1 Tax=Manihot esculenta TaxID=3983 RepID=A0ACB7FYG3_MANES|nr:hypothetical protein MANES_18G045401v8 [Manihot esculenta]